MCSVFGWSIWAFFLLVCFLVQIIQIKRKYLQQFYIYYTISDAEVHPHIPSRAASTITD